MISPPGGRRQAQAIYELAGIWGRGGRRPLLIDLDPLGRLTRLCGIEPPAIGGVSDVLVGRGSLAGSLRRLPFFDVVPASRLLAGFDVLARRQHVHPLAFERALDELAADHRLALFALPHEGGLALWSAFLAFADAAAVLVDPGTLGLAGVEATLERLEHLVGARPLPLALTVLGLHLRSPLAQNFLVGLRARWSAWLLDVLVPDADQGPVEARVAALRALAGELEQRLRRPLPGCAPRPTLFAPPAALPATEARPQVPPVSPWTP